MFKEIGGVDVGWGGLWWVGCGAGVGRVGWDVLLQESQHNYGMLLLSELNASEMQQEVSIRPFRLPDASMAEEECDSM